MNEVSKTIVERRKDKLDMKPKRYFDANYGATVIKVMPGEFVMTREPSEMLVSVLGSCVAACIRDPKTGFGGMNHFMLPSGEGKSQWGSASAAYRYGNAAMEVLINAVLKSGCPKEDMEIKVFGGANVTNAGKKIGSSNADFVEEYLKQEGYKIAAKDLRGHHPRRIHYFPFTGQVKQLYLKRNNDDSRVSKSEHSYLAKLRKAKQGGEIELFEE